eukprot:3330119-Rhodomonas_salina.4
MRLVTKKTGNVGDYKPDELLGIFTPFDRMVWALVVANIFFASFAIYMVESGIQLAILMQHRPVRLSEVNELACRVPVQVGTTKTTSWKTLQSWASSESFWDS